MSHMWVGDTKVYVPYGGTLRVTTKRFYEPDEKKHMDLLQKLNDAEKSLARAEKDKQRLQTELAQMKKQVEELKKKNSELEALDLR